MGLSWIGGRARVYRMIKRAVDVTTAAALLVVTAPIQLVVAAAIVLKMGRPVMFRQQRPGLHGAPFELIKFRTMRSEPGARPSSDAYRLTRLGHRLRATSLDELLTLWNVVRGDMSLVGPRPLLMDYLGLYTTEQARRHDVRPGVTGLAQVRGRNALDWETKFVADVEYVDHMSLRLDVQILLATVRAVIRREGVTATDHATMPEFRG